MGQFGNAQICLNGHVITSIGNDPQFLKKFCSRCGAETIMNCKYCDSSIKGIFLDSTFGSPNYKTPSFCDNCGHPYPWTQNKKEAALAMINFADKLDSKEKEELGESIDDLMKETPRTVIAEMKFKKYVLKAGSEIAKGLKDVLIDVVSETVKKSIWSA